MALWFYIQEFLEDLKTQKTRAFLTASAIAWGTLAVTLLLAFGEGLKQRMVSSFLNAGDRIVIVYGGQTSKPYQGHEVGRRIRLTEEDVRILKESLNSIDMISPQYGRWNTRLTYKDNTALVYAVGVEPPFEFMRRMYPIQGGRFLNEWDIKKKRRVVFLGIEIAEELFGKENAIGKIIEIDNVPFQVIGVMQRKLQTSMNNGPDTRRAVIPASTFKTLYGFRNINHIAVRPKDVSATEFLKKQIRQILGRRHRFDPTDSSALHMWDFVEQEKLMRKIFVGMQIFMGIVGALTLLVAGIGVANIMFVIVKERTREIGIKKAVGARNLHILAQFIFEALLITFIGGATGLLATWTVVQLVSLLPANKPPLQYMGHPTLSPLIMGLTVFILGFIGMLAGIFPARRATRVDPVESLRYE